MIDDILIFTENGLDTLKKYVNFLFEGRSKEQQEIAQRAMAKIEMQPINKLRNYVIEKWKYNKKTKEDYIQAKKEFYRLGEVIFLASRVAGKSNGEISKYVENVLGDIPNWIIDKDLDGKNAFIQAPGKVPRISLTSNKNIEEILPVDLKIKNPKKYEKIIRQWIILHEYGHLYDYLKEFVETGKFPEQYDTLNSILNRDFKKIIDKEGKANGYAIDNLYRKDRRKALEQSKKYSKNEINNAVERLKKEYKEPNTSGLSASDLYSIGSLVHSKKLIDTISNLDKK